MQDANEMTATGRGSSNPYHPSKDAGDPHLEGRRVQSGEYAANENDRGNGIDNRMSMTAPVKPEPHMS